ncbi:helix-turn-helix domain-containing protein [Tessaracoccus rhinocerotis]|uniref:Helix-turn-helix domain-containing protein n=1 Tax=Tessaracoccus rhinocerotis TaxID=1689449 RepID=A0A553K412_9ACTN|nr:helix-turn-helix domain-containing protein [Tessaracoccus rhinocerotis]
MDKAGSVVRRARRWATLHQAATYLNCHPKTISRRLTDGTLSRYRIGRRLLVDLDEVDAVLETSSYRAPQSRRSR